jgi:hypothetical protein
VTRPSIKQAKAGLAELGRRGLLQRDAGNSLRDLFKLPPLNFNKSLVEAILQERREAR